MFFFFKKKCKQKSLLGVESNQVYTMEIEKKKNLKSVLIIHVINGGPENIIFTFKLFVKQRNGWHLEALNTSFSIGRSLSLEHDY